MNLRRWITALAVLTLFAGLASAQFQNLATITCQVSAGTTPNVRSEGINERVGDVLISCGNATTAPTEGSAVDRGTLLVDFGAALTSRADAAVNNVGKPSEIVLMFDEPGAGNGPVAAYGQNAAASVCTAAQAQADQALVVAGNNEAAPVNCIASLHNVVNALGSYWVLDKGAPIVPPAVFAPAGQAANVYQGAIGGSNITGVTHTGNQVMFYDVPILPSGAGNLTHLFRISNARITPGSVATITATLTPATLAVGGNPVTGARWQYAFTGSPVTVGTSGTSLTASVVSVGGASLCTSTALAPTGPTKTRANLALLSFKENAAGAFKTRVLGLNNALADAEGNGQGAAPQIKPGGSYTIGAAPNTVTVTTTTSESGVIVPGLAVGGTVAGLSSTGTRLKAKFANLDANATYYVSLNPVIDYSTPVPLGTNPVTQAAGVAGDLTQTGWAVLQATGTATNGNAASETAAYNAAGQDATNDAVPVAKVLRASDGTGEVFWEVTNTAPGAAQTLTFALYAVYSNITNPPTVGNTATVQLGYAPTTASSGAASTTIPRFVAPSGTTNFFNVLPCQTTLLFPFVTNQGGFETGLAIANTSADPFKTPNSQGTCGLNFFGTYSGAGTPPSNPVAFFDPSDATRTAVTLAAGKTLANTTSIELGANVTFQGYMIAVCNFQFAHGFAFISNGAPSVGSAMGYLALVVANTSGRGQTLLGEQLTQ